MKKLKGQGKLTKLIASRVAKLNRSYFSTLVYNTRQLEQIAKCADSNQTVALNLVGFSSSNDYPEQILSILSFIRHVGTPLSWTIYSDGSHTNIEVENVQAALPFVKVVKSNVVCIAPYNTDDLKSTLRPYTAELNQYARAHFLGKRLLLYLNHIVDRPTLFLDSDVIFYAKSPVITTLLSEPINGCFLKDKVWGCLDSRYLIYNRPERHQVNAGFFLLNCELTELDRGLNFLKNLGHTYEYFSEQTIMHILLTSNKLKPLDPELFIVNTCDQFDFSYAYTRDKIAIRHYTGPIRHKMWQRDWKWHLSMD
jgi:hypothetical protein